MIVYWDERSSDQSCSVKDISSQCGGQDSALNDLGSKLAIVVKTVEELVLAR
jgi:hypothetical protein